MPRSVVDHRPIEPRNDGIGCPQALPVDGEDRGGVEQSELLTVRNEAVVSHVLQPVGEYIEVCALGGGEHGASEVELHVFMLAGDIRMVAIAAS